MTNEISVSETKLLEIKAQVAKPGLLEIQVKNTSGAPLVEPLRIEFKVPVEWVDERIGVAAEKARTSETPPNMATLEGVVDVAKGWSVWAFNDPNDHLAAVRIFNNIDQTGGQTSVAFATIDAGKELSLGVPLRQQGKLTQITIPYSYQYGGRKAPRVDGTIDVTPPITGNWTPRVSLTTDQANPMMIPFTTKVKISWKIANAVGAVLRGPLSGGHSELRLSSDRNSDFWVEQGSIEVRAVGPVTYLLDAEVKGPADAPNVQVIRTVSLDISKAENYGSLRLLPDRALPYDQVQIQWAVWGVKIATILFGSHLSYELKLTEQDLSRNYNGVGIWSVRIPGDHEQEKVSLQMRVDEGTLPAIDRDIRVASWSALPHKAQFTGKPIALAYSEKNLALLAGDGLWLAFVGANDTELKDPTFRRISTDTPKKWLALTVLDKSLVVLRQTSGDDLQLLLFGPDGKTQDIALDLPGDLKPVTRRDDSSFQLVAFGNRVYVVVESAAGQRPRVLSAAFAPNGIRPEPLLELLPKYQLVAFNDGLYALNRATGEMLRYEAKPGGELDGPWRAAKAIDKGSSMIRSGLALSLGQVLIVLGPAVPTFDDEQARNLLGATGIPLQPLRTPAEAKAAHQDLVYNPQKDKWGTCGHGLTLQTGALAAYRGGASKRLWVLQPNAEIHTLQAAGEGLFAPDYVPRFPSTVLPDALDSKLDVQVKNQSFMDLVAVDSVCQAAGLTSLSAAGLARVTPIPGDFSQRVQQKFTIAYKADSAPVTLRFMAKDSEKGSARFVLELTFSGTALSTITSVFKRLAIDKEGAVSVMEVPGTSTQHPANQLVDVPPATHLIQRPTLYVINSTFDKMSLSPIPKGAFAFPGDFVFHLNFGYNTPTFDATFPDNDKVGRLHFDIDFAQRFGMEASFKDQVQQNLLRVRRDDEGMLDVNLVLVRKGTTFHYELADGTGGDIKHGSGADDGFACVIRPRTKRAIAMIRAGDAVPSDTGERFLVPVTKPLMEAPIEIWSFDSVSFASSKAPFQPAGGVFSVPNTLVPCKDRIYAVFGDTRLFELDSSLNVKRERSYPDYTYICALAATPSGDLFMLAEKQENRYYGLEQTQWVLVEAASGLKAFKLANAPSNFWGMEAMAVSPDGKKVFISKQGGLIVVDTASGNLSNIEIPSARESCDLTISRNGAWIYCCHAQRQYDISGDAFRPGMGSNLTVSRVNAANFADIRTISLPDVGRNFGITRGGFGTRVVGEKLSEPIAFRLAVSPDDRTLFVSAGNTIYKIDSASFTLSPWTKVLELSCRVFHVKEGKRNTWNVLALGSYYHDNGRALVGYGTHLYTISVPKS